MLRVPRLSSSSDVGGSGRPGARPALPPTGKKRVQLRFFVPVQFVAAVLRALDLQPHAQDPFFFGVRLLVAWPVVAGGHVGGELVQALVPPCLVVIFAGALFPPGDLLQAIAVGGGEGVLVVVLAPSEAEEPGGQGPFPCGSRL